MVDLALGKSGHYSWALSGAHRLSLHAWRASSHHRCAVRGGAGPRIRRLVTFARHVVQTDTRSHAVSGQETRHVRSGGGTTAHPLRGINPRSLPFGGSEVGKASRCLPGLPLYMGKSGRNGEPPPRGAPWETANAWRSARSSPATLSKRVVYNK